MIRIITEQWRLENIIITVYHDGSISIGDYSFERLFGELSEYEHINFNCRCALMPYSEEAK